jgi:hypothetical protein
MTARELANRARRKTVWRSLFAFVLKESMEAFSLYWRPLGMIIRSVRAEALQSGNRESLQRKLSTIIDRFHSLPIHLQEDVLSASRLSGESEAFSVLYQSAFATWYIHNAGVAELSKLEKELEWVLFVQCEDNQSSDSSSARDDSESKSKSGKMKSWRD